ncbi:MAG TPA: hypothetical protein PKA61_07570 [Nitrospira sp.]|nr:hypothetical protein [Nitrospira sp.]
MKVRARRGVCIGVDKHLKADDEADLDGALVTFLVGIGAVDVVKDVPAPAPVEAESADEQAPSLSEAETKAVEPNAKTTEPDDRAGERQSGKKKEK